MSTKIYKPKNDIIFIIPIMFLILWELSWVNAVLVVLYCLGLSITYFYTKHIIEFSESALLIKNFFNKKIKTQINYDELQGFRVDKKGASTKVTLVDKNHKEFTINSNDYKKIDDLYKQLTSKFTTKPTIYEDTSVSASEVSKRTANGIFFALIVMILGMLISFLIDLSHINSENWGSWFFITCPVGVLLSYFYIRNEPNNQFPLLSAITVGLVLGASLTVVSVNINRLINENSRFPVEDVEMKLIEISTEKNIKTKNIIDILNEYRGATTVSKDTYKQQKWQFIDSEKLNSKYFYLTDESDEIEYNNRIHENEIYKIKMVKGNLNDWFFESDAFINAVKSQ